MARKIVGPKGAQSGGTTSVPEVIVSVKPPETADDHILLALEKTGLDAVVRTLRDWCGSREIRNSLNRLSHRDPVDPFKQIQRHAVRCIRAVAAALPATAPTNGPSRRVSTPSIIAEPIKIVLQPFSPTSDGNAGNARITSDGGCRSGAPPNDRYDQHDGHSIKYRYG